MKKQNCALMLLAIVLCVLPGCYTVSEGERVGTITKFSNKGILVKTWEGEMVLGGSGASGNAQNTWSFTVEDPAVVEKIRSAQKQTQVVSLAYKEELYVAPWRGDTHHFVHDVISE